MFDSDVLGTTIEAIASDLQATADYLLTDRKDSSAEKERQTVLHVTRARIMLNDVLGDIEEAK